MLKFVLVAMVTNSLTGEVGALPIVEYKSMEECEHKIHQMGYVPLREPFRYLGAFCAKILEV